MTIRRRTEFLVVMVLALVSTAAACLLPESPPSGFVGRYWANASWTGAPTSESVGALPTAADVLRHVPGADVGVASAEWAGILTVDRAGTFQFTVRSDDGAWLWVDDRLLVDNGGAHGAQSRAARTALGLGAHRIRIRYFQAGGPLALAVTWSRLGGSPAALGPDSVAPTIEAAAARRPPSWLRRGVVAVPFVWALLLLYVPVRGAGWWTWREVTRAAPDPRVRAGLAVLMVLAAGLMAWGIEWGIRGDEWGPDELRPEIVRDALSQRFSGGWHDKYPAMHYMVLGLPLAAFEFAERFPALSPNALDRYAAQFLVIRLVSVVMGLGTLAALFLCAVELFGPRRAVFAAFALLLTPLFVFYGKVANLDGPALCWFGWTLVGFLRVIQTGDRASYVLMGIAAAAAVATKDQAYASLALLIPPVFLATASRQSASSWRARAWSALTDSRLMAGAAVTIAASAVFHNAILNPAGFVAHLRLLASFNDIAVVPRTPSGAAALTWKTADLFRMSLGWPLLVLAIVGMVRAWVVPGRRWWLWLLLVPVSFHLTFTWVTFFVCDRYVFPGVFVLALFAGSAMADLADARRARVAAWSAVSLALGVSLLSAASINVMMNLDARKAAREWVGARAREGAVIGLVGRYMPYFPPPLSAETVETTEALAMLAPEYVVVNNRFAARYRAGASVAGRDLVAGLEHGLLGFDETFRYRAPLPVWALLQYEPSFRGNGESWWTNLDKVNPEMLVYRKR